MNIIKILRKRIDYLHGEINKIPYFKGIKPEGGFIIYRYIKKKMGSTEFANLLLINIK